MNHTDIDIESLSHSREPGQPERMRTASIVTGAIVIAALALLLGGMTLGPLFQGSPSHPGAASLPVLPPEAMVDLSERVRFQSQVRLFIAQLRGVKQELASHGESVNGLTELIEQMEMLLKAIDPMRSQT